MRLLEKVIEIFSRYEIKPIDTLGYKDAYELTKEVPESLVDFVPATTDFALIVAYREYIPRGYYGFSLGTPTPKIWVQIIKDILDICIEADPNLEIHSIKIKFGFVCFYVHSEVIEDINDIEVYISKTLNDPSLKY